jgi:hypothetical protein
MPGSKEVEIYTKNGAALKTCEQISNAEVLNCRGDIEKITVTYNFET